MTQPKPISKRRPGLSFWGLIEVGSLILCLATATGFLGKIWWIFELTSHFKVQLAILLVATTAIWLVRKRWWVAGVCGAFGLINVASVVPQFIPNGAAPLNIGPTVKLVGVNVHTPNREVNRMLRFLNETKPDLLLLMEVNQRWMEDLEGLRSDYPYQVSRPRDDNFGIALFSRLALTNATILYLGEAGVPSVATDVLTGDTTFHLLGTHPLPPGSSEYARLRNEQLVRISEYVHRQSVPVVVLGDLNATPWSPHFESLLKNGGLQNSAKGHGVLGSWPAGLPLMRIPLDHCLISPSIQIKSRSLGPAVGGDHLPIVVELVSPGQTRWNELASPRERQPHRPRP